MVGRLFYSTAMHTSSPNNRALHSIHNQSFPIQQSTLLFQHCLLLFNPPTYTHPPYIHLICAHIPTQPTSHLSPTYTYTAYISLIPTDTYTAYISFIPTYTYKAYISFIPHIYLHSLHLINPHRYLHSLHLIYPHIYLHSLHLINPHIYLHTLHLINPHIYLHSLHLINPPHIPTHPTSH